MICVFLVLILSMCHTRVVLQGIIHVCNFFFNDHVYKIFLHVFSSWVCDLLDIMKINLSKRVNLNTRLYTMSMSLTMFKELRKWTTSVILFVCVTLKTYLDIYLSYMMLSHSQTPRRQSHRRQGPDLYTIWTSSLFHLHT